MMASRNTVKHNQVTSDKLQIDPLDLFNKLEPREPSPQTNILHLT